LGNLLEKSEILTENKLVPTSLKKKVIAFSSSIYSNVRELPDGQIRPVLVLSFKKNFDKMEQSITVELDTQNLLKKQLCCI
jgi:hypothetical protein